MAGNKERKAISTAQSIGACIPMNQKIRPPSVPCTAATMMFPLIVARMIVHELAEEVALQRLLQRNGLSDTPRQSLTVAQKKEHEV